MIICYTVSEIRQVTNRNLGFHFGQFFTLLPPDRYKKIKFLKNEKTPGDIILHMCTINDNHMMHDS